LEYVKRIRKGWKALFLKAFRIGKYRPVNLSLRSHNPKVVGSNPTPATKENQGLRRKSKPFFFA
jgi:hypothetical protein